MKHHPTAQTRATNDNDACAVEAQNARPRESVHDIAAAQPAVARGAKRTDTATQPSSPTTADARQRTSQITSRGLTTQIHPTVLQRIVWLSALTTLNRFRVIRAIDVALACFPERPFKAALTAAQRAMRGMAKAGLVRRYRTDRFQHVYGLTTAGSAWLEDYGILSSPSVRRVADMTNPEHRLWMNAIVLACEARGLRAHTESEALQELNRGRKEEEPVRQGFVQCAEGHLRPDAVAYEPDGITWFEIDRSKRGEQRRNALSSLVRCVGKKLKHAPTLRRIVVFARTNRILQDALAVLRDTAKVANAEVINPDYGRHFKEVEPGVFEVWAAVWPPGGGVAVDVCIGHVIIELLPTWLPKVRLDSSNKQPLSGWFDENYLPYRRPQTSEPWSQPVSPLLESLPLVTPNGGDYTRR
ncbi:hypothetical protein BJN34_21615 [Cupriavidus necator]|uniref:Replication-relaxation n=1 Tax=Cupriavidus necator TaxID=106590 RepID=A0A1U9UV69_CUPNE|nr:replication-relaxation family protein [Cupriavidus necator]AQV96469.1 hypothetical protein BJN34_21615 [Cupriavidus necator]